MTQLLEEASGEARKLSASEQDAIATLIIKELADERRWDAAFANSQDLLSRPVASVTSGSTSYEFATCGGLLAVLRLIARCGQGSGPQGLSVLEG